MYPHFNSSIFNKTPLIHRSTGVKFLDSFRKKYFEHTPHESKFTMSDTKTNEENLLEKYVSHGTTLLEVSDNEEDYLLEDLEETRINKPKF